VRLIELVRRQCLNQVRCFAGNEVSLMAPEQSGDHRLPY
jgi:hypothetical protein